MTKMNTSLKITVLGILSSILLSRCYSFKGISINPNASTFYVAPFDIEVADATPPPATLSITFSEELKDRILQETRLRFKDADPDLEFSGKLIGYTVTSEAPKVGETTSFNRLTIRVAVTYTDHKAPEPKPQKRTFSFFQDYPTNQNLLNVQDQLIEDINKELVDMIFNWAFNNW